MDPLAILREFTLAGRLDEVSIDGPEGDGPPGDRVRFGDRYTFRKSDPTAFRLAAGAGDHCSLLSVAFYIKQVHELGSNMGTYVARAMQRKVPAVGGVTDRAVLRDYLTGKIATAPHIADAVPLVAFDTAAGGEAVGAKRRREAAADAEDAAAAAAAVQRGDAAALAQIFEQERQLRDRNSLLCAPGANFKPVLEMLDRVMAARKSLQADGGGKGGGGDKHKGKPQQQQQQPQHRQSTAARPGAQVPGQQQQHHHHQHQQQQQQPAFMKASGRMERDNVAGAYQAMGGGAAAAAALGRGYGIGAAEPAQGGAAAAAAQGGVPPPPVPAPGPGPRPMVAGQQQQQQRPPSSSQQQQQHRSSGGKHGSGGKGGSGGSGGSGSGGSLTAGPPIIIVPSAPSALVTMYNARQLLEEGRFVRSDEAMAALPPGSTKPEKIEFTRRMLRSGPKFPRYVVTDRPPPTGHPDWRRVVAAVALGKAWQFKEYPFKGADRGDLVDAFSRLFGAYFYYADERVTEPVSGWKVARLPLRRTARHLDETMALEFWTKLDAFLQGRRCQLEY